MRVESTCTLKNSSVGLISAGTIFEGTMETLPDFVVDELNKKRGTFKILPDLIQKKKKKKAAQKPSPKNPVKPEVEAETSPKVKSPSLREKLSNPEK
jgi:DNA replication initiation complex subunit (GINS family)